MSEQIPMLGDIPKDEPAQAPDLVIAHAVVLTLGVKEGSRIRFTLEWMEPLLLSFFGPAGLEKENVEEIVRPFLDRSVSSGLIRRSAAGEIKGEQYRKDWLDEVHNQNKGKVRFVRSESSELWIRARLEGDITQSNKRGLQELGISSQSKLRQGTLSFELDPSNTP